MQDLRLPIGLFFVIVGAILSLTRAEPTPMTSAPVNLVAGLVMAVFGGVMMWLAVRKA